MSEPIAPGEHPDLPRLHCELLEAQGEHQADGRTFPAHPAYARFLFSPQPVVVTASLARIRRYAHRLLTLADELELVQRDGIPGQQTLDMSAAS